MCFIMSMITTIVTLLWSIQFFATIRSEATIIWLNVLMIITWIVQCVLYIYLQGLLKAPIQLRIPLLGKKTYQIISINENQQEPILQMVTEVETKK